MYKKDCNCISTAQVIEITKLQTHDEVIDAIIEGLSNEARWDQRRVIHTSTKSNEYPCGTQFCMLGAIFTKFNIAPAYIPISELSALVLDESILYEWTNVFQLSSQDHVLVNLIFLSKEQQARLIPFLTLKSINLR